MSNAVSATMLITAGEPGRAIRGVSPLTIAEMFSTAVRVLPHPLPVMISHTNQSPRRELLVRPATEGPVVGELLARASMPYRRIAGQ